ncbi:MAG: DNA repair protein RecO, partial [Opitutae bacterium]|nr:DNA repair protein RecO [Opitutae bacterium]
CTCIGCRRGLDALGTTRLGFDPARGGLVCADCNVGQRLPVSRGTLKQLTWIATGDLARAERMRFSAEALDQGERLMEAFVSFHLGREPRSLKFLRHLRDTGAGG